MHIDMQYTIVQLPRGLQTNLLLVPCPSSSSMRPLVLASFRAASMSPGVQDSQVKCRTRVQEI